MEEDTMYQVYRIGMCGSELERKIENDERWKSGYITFDNS